MSRVAVRPTILRWARERVGKDLEELQARFRADFGVGERR